MRITLNGLESDENFIAVGSDAEEIAEYIVPAK